MDAVMYLKERARMTNGCSDCTSCPMRYDKNGFNLGCRDLEAISTETAVEIVEKWSKEHPRKTYLTDFLEKYPKARLIKSGIPIDICPFYLGYTEKRFDDGCGMLDECLECWNTPMDE